MDPLGRGDSKRKFEDVGDATSPSGRAKQLRRSDSSSSKGTHKRTLEEMGARADQAASQVVRGRSRELQSSLGDFHADQIEDEDIDSDDEDRISIAEPAVHVDPRITPQIKRRLLTAVEGSDAESLREVLFIDLDFEDRCYDPLVALVLKPHIGSIKNDEGKSLVDLALGAGNSAVIKMLYEAGQMPFDATVAKAYREAGEGLLEQLPPFTHQDMTEALSDKSNFVAMHLDHMKNMGDYEGGNPASAMLVVAHLLLQHPNQKYQDLANQYNKAASVERALDQIHFKVVDEGDVEADQLLECESEHALRKMATQLAVSLISLEPGKSVLLPGGWHGPRGAIGHSMLYEIKREEDGTYSFTIFNSGEGLELVHPEEIVGNKSLHQQGIKICGIAPESMCSPERLIELLMPLAMSHREGECKRIFNAKDIYHSFLSNLASAQKGEDLKVTFFSIEGDENNLPFMTPQRSGTCSWSACLPLLAMEFGVKEYKTFRYDGKKLSLEDCCNTLKADRDHIYLLEQAIESFARTALKQDDPNYFDALELIEKCEAKIAEKKAGLAGISEDVRPPVKVKIDQTRSAFGIGKAALTQQLRKVPNFHLEGKSIEQRIDVLSAFGEEIKQHKDDLPATDILQFVVMVETIFLHESMEHLQSLDSKTMPSLVNLASTYISLCEYPTPTNILTFSCMQMAAYEMACKLNKDLKDHRPVNGLVHVQKWNGYMLLKDPQLEERNRQVVEYFSVNEDDKLFEYLQKAEMNVHTNLDHEICLLEGAEKNERLVAAGGKLREEYNRANSSIGNTQPIHDETFENACFIADLGEYNILQEPLLSLKRLSVLSFALDNHKWTKDDTKKKLEIRFPQERKKFPFVVCSLTRPYSPSRLVLRAVEEQTRTDNISGAPVISNILGREMQEDFSLEKHKPEALAAVETPKSQSLRPLDRIKTLFNCPDLEGERLFFILNEMDDKSQFSRFEVRKLFEIYAFCVDGSVAGEIRNSPFLQEHISDFLTGGFKHFARKQPVDYFGALYFIRLSHYFSRYTGQNPISSESHQIFDRWVNEALGKGTTMDPKTKAEILVHKCLLLETKEHLEKDDVYALLAADVLTTSFGLGQLYQDGEVLLEFRKLRHVKDNAISDWFEKNASNPQEIVGLINRLTELFSTKDTSSQWKGPYPEFTNEKGCRWDFAHSVYSNPDGYITAPPGHFAEYYGEEIPHVFRKEGEITFEHSRLGKFRCILKGSNYDVYNLIKIPMRGGVEEWAKLGQYTPKVLERLFTPSQFSSLQLEDGTVVFADMTTREVTYFLDKDGLHRIHPKEDEGDWTTKPSNLAQYLPSVQSVVDPMFTFPFKSSWEFPSFIMQNGKPLSLDIRPDGTVSHRELGILRKNYEDGLHFIDEVGNERVLFPNAPFAEPAQIHRNTVEINGENDLCDVFIFEKDSNGIYKPKTDEERVFLIGYYIAKNQYENAIGLYNEWHSPAGLSFGATKAIVDLMSMTYWLGVQPNQVALMLKLLSKVSFEQIAADMLKSSTGSHRHEDDFESYLEKNEGWMRNLFAGVDTESHFGIFADASFVGLTHEERVLVLTKKLLTLASSKIAGNLTTYYDVEGNVSDSCRANGSEILPLLEILEKTKFLTDQLSRAKQFYTDPKAAATSATKFKPSTFLKGVPWEDCVCADLQGFLDPPYNIYYRVLTSPNVSQNLREEVRNRLRFTEKPESRFFNLNHAKTHLVLAYIYIKGYDAISRKYDLSGTYSRDGSAELPDGLEAATIEYFSGEGSQEIKHFFGPNPIPEEIAVYISKERKKEIKKVVQTSQPWPTISTKVVDVGAAFGLENFPTVEEKIECMSHNVAKKRGEVRNLENELRALANKLPADSINSHRIQLLRIGGLQPLLEVSDLVRLFLQRNTKELEEKTHLNETDFQLLMTRIPEFLEASVHLQQMERALNLSAVAEANPEDKVEIFEEINSICTSKRAYTLNAQTVSFLVFEYATGFILREKQVEILQRLKGGTNLCQQFGMGGGKTKVILPLLALDIADGNTLPIVIVTEALLETNLHDMSEASYAKLRQKGVAFKWDLNTPIDPGYLEERYQQLLAVTQNRGYLISTPSAFHSLFLKHKELLDQQSMNYSPEVQMSILGIEKIRKFFKTRGHAIPDEFDSIMTTRNESIFASGEPQHLDVQQVANVKELYRKMVEEEKIDLNKQYLLEPDALRKETGHLHSSDVTMAESGEPTSSVEDILNEEIDILMPITLSKRAGVDYGPSKEHSESLYCIPYKAVDTPKEGSEFGSPLEAINYSFQYYLVKGITLDNAKDWLGKMVRAANSESVLQELDFSDTETARQFFTMSGVSLQDLCNRPDAAEAFRDLVNNNMSLKLNFVEEQVAPKIVFFPKTYTSNAQIFCSFFNVVQGVTATPYNFQTYPSKIQTVFDDKLLNDIKTEVRRQVGSKEIGILTENSVKSVFAQLPPDENRRAFIDVGAFFEGHKNEEVAHEILQHFHPRDGAMEVDRNAVKAVLYFEGDRLTLMKMGDDGKPVKIPLKGSDPEDIAATGFTSKQIFTYYDQNHTTGMDIPQKIGASAVLFVSRLTLSRDLWQAAGRMRGITTKGQKIVPVMSAAEAATIMKKGPVLTFNEVERHCKALEMLQNKEDNLRATVQKMQNVALQYAEFLIAELPPSHKLLVVAALQDTQLLYQVVESFINKGHNESIDTFTFVAKMKDDILNIVDKMQRPLVPFMAPERLKEYRDRAEHALQRSLEKVKVLLQNDQLPQKTMISAFRGKEVQKQVQQHKEAKKQKQTQLNITNAHNVGRTNQKFTHVNSFDWGRINTCEDLLEHCLTLDKSRQALMKNSASAFSENLFVSPLLDTPLVTQGVNCSPFSDIGETPYHVLGIFDKEGTVKYVLLSLNDVNNLSQKPLPNSFLFSSVTGKVKSSNLDPSINLRGIMQSDGFREILIQTRFLAGDINHLTKESEFPHLQRWYRQGGPEPKAARKATLGYTLNKQQLEKLAANKRMVSLLTS